MIFKEKFVKKEFWSSINSTWLLFILHEGTFCNIEYDFFSFCCIVFKKGKILFVFQTKIRNFRDKKEFLERERNFLNERLDTLKQSIQAEIDARWVNSAAQVAGDRRQMFSCSGSWW